jgi:flagellar basal body-associated protein FliL
MCISSDTIAADVLNESNGNVKPVNIMNNNEPPTANSQSGAPPAPPRSLPADTETPNGYQLHVLRKCFAMLSAILLLYTVSVIPAQVLFVKGFFIDKQRIFHVLEIVYVPLEKIYDRSPAFRNGLDWCVAEMACLPKQEKRGYSYVNNLGQHELADTDTISGIEPQSGTETKKMSVPFNKLLVNVAGTMGQRYLLVKFTVVGAGGKIFKAKMAEHDAQLRDVAMSALATKTLAELEKPGARKLIGTELINGFNKVIGDNSVQEICMTEFGIQ